LDCIFVSDIHGKTKRYEKLFQIIKKEQPDGVFLGGDLLPNQFTDSSIDIFIKKQIFSEIKKISKVISIKESDETGHMTFKNGGVSCRGNKKYFRALVEFDDKTISEVDATVEEW